MPFGSDIRIIGGPGGSEEEMVGAAHASKTDTLNRLALFAHHKDGTHDAQLLPVMCQCRLTKDGSNTKFAPIGIGNLVPIKDSDGWFLRQIASAGITLAVTGLSVDTFYRIYAFDSSGTVTLEASTTGTAIDTDTGVRIKSGDATRTFVGIAYTDNPLAWTDSATERWVRSFYNRLPLLGADLFTSDFTTTSTTYVASGLQISAVIFDSESIDLLAWGAAKLSGTQDIQIGLSEDSTTVALAASESNWRYITNESEIAMINRTIISPSEGKHDYRVIAKQTTGATLTMIGSSGYKFNVESLGV